MKIDVLSVFPNMFRGPLSESLLKKAQDKNLVNIKIHNIRSFTKDKHRIVDDRPFGGGPGMVFKPEPVYRALHSLGAARKRRLSVWPKKKDKPLVIYLSPQGRLLTQDLVHQLVKYKHLILLCGHYEGIDERIMEWVNQEVSIGDYVLTGGELPALVLIDSVVRFLPGVVKKSESIQQDSFMEGMLDCPCYTRPAKFRGLYVPDVLLSGNHAKIKQWRKEQSILYTLKKRPDLMSKIKLSDKEKQFIKGIKIIKSKRR